MRALAALLCTLAVLIAAPVARADAMRCGSRVVRDGDTQSFVRNFCGEPTDVQTRTILRRPHYAFHGNYYVYGDGAVEVPVEIWTYNFGPYKLMRRVRFTDGLVTQIDTLGYGYHAAEPAESAPERRDTYR